ncbi:RNA polymerase sigma-70 factor (family 1) [Pedobacter africanus]|uniref:RNA polymerase sigma-70 factor (ECF subfamily) n=1 Tax=Pedobacter africanus TaxID=151894 RepID=A0ACC6KVV1_9SPHI|nr:RNA polymerase sigma-70 factor [Pedobacter africanus]MDR6783305.1 RNA polymerase sigma-70 factor (ECF subfamily) [Pedobacter africanus]
MPVKPIDHESELLAKIAGGDQYAFTVLFNHYERDVYAVGKKLTWSHDRAIEIVQEIFIKIWDNRASLITVENFGAYLNRLVKNHSLNVLKKMSRESRNNQVLQSVSTELDDSTSIQLDYNDALGVLNEALDSLTPQQRKVYILCHQQGLKYEEAAAQLNISSSTVNVHMTLALKKIRAHFAKNAVFYPLLVMMLSK